MSGLHRQHRQDRTLQRVGDVFGSEAVNIPAFFFGPHNGTRAAAGQRGAEPLEQSYIRISYYIGDIYGYMI